MVYRRTTYNFPFDPVGFNKDLSTLKKDSIIDGKNIEHIFTAAKRSKRKLHLKNKITDNPYLDDRQKKLIKHCVDRATSNVRPTKPSRSPKPKKLSDKKPKIKGFNQYKLRNKLINYTGSHQHPELFDRDNYFDHVIDAALESKDVEEFGKKMDQIPFIKESVYQQEMKEDIMKLFAESIKQKPSR